MSETVATETAATDEASPSMPKAARGATLVGLPLVVVFEATSYFGVRTAQGLAGALDVGPSLTSTIFLSLGGTLVAAVAGLALGPWSVLAAGTAILTLGAALGLVLPPEAAFVGLSVVLFGHGMARPALYAAAAAPFGRDEEHARSAFFVGLSLAATVGGFFGPMGVGTLAEATPSVGFAAVVLLAVSATAGAMVLAWRVRSARRLGWSAAPARAARVGLLLGLIALSAFPLGVGSHLGFLERVELISQGPEFASLWIGLEAFLDALVGLTALGGLLLLHRMRARVPTFALIGVGFVATALSCALFAVVERMGALFWIATLLAPVGSILVGPVLYSRLCGDLPSGVATAVMGAWFLLTSSFGALLRALDLHLPPSVLWVGAGSGFLLGLALFAGARRLDRVLHPPDEQTPTKF